MELYKEKLKIQTIFMFLGSILLFFFSFLAIGSELGWFSFIKPLAGDSHWHSSWHGYITGASFGIGITFLFCVFRNLKALRSEKRLKAQYIKEYDERNLQIQTLARNTTMQILLWLGCVATIIAVYFSVSVSITILACTFVSAATSLIMILYYCKKF